MKNLKNEIRGPAYMFCSDFFTGPYGTNLRVTLRGLADYNVLLSEPVPKNNTIGLTDEL